jgi:hypothetical protein
MSIVTLRFAAAFGGFTNDERETLRMIAGSQPIF